MITNSGIQAITVAVALLGFLGAPTVAAPDTPPVIGLSLDTPSSIVPGEPIIVKYQLSNPVPDQKMGIGMNPASKDWYALTLTDEVGQTVPHRSPRLERPNMLSGIHPANGFLARGDSQDGTWINYIVVSREAAPSHPGHYTLTIHVNIPYASAPLSATGQSDALTKASGTVFAKDFSFPIVVTPANPTRLQQTAAQIQQEMKKEGAGAHFSALARALFSMPESAAFTSWQQLAENSGERAHFYADLYAQELMGVDSPGAADLLTEMIQNTSLTSENHIYIGRCLKRMYNTGDAALKAHISQVCSEKGISLDTLFDFPTVL